MLSWVFPWLLSNKAGLPGIESRCVLKFTSLSASVHQKLYPGWSQYLILPPCSTKYHNLAVSFLLCGRLPSSPIIHRAYLATILPLSHSSSIILRPGLNCFHLYRIRPNLKPISSKKWPYHQPPTNILLAVANPHQRQALHQLSLSILPYNLLAYTQC